MKTLITPKYGIFWLLLTTLFWSSSLLAQDLGSSEPAEPDAQEGESLSAEEPAEDQVDSNTDGQAELAGQDVEATPEEPLPKNSDGELSVATEQRLREIGTKVDALKEDTFATKSRLLLLRESVLRRTIAGSKVVVLHNNEMGTEYKLVQVLYALDRQSKFTRLDHTGELDDLDAIVIDEQLVPGSHLLMVQLGFKGNGWGIFRYMDGYTFTVESAYAFTAQEGKGHEIVVRAYEDGSVFTPIEERPTISYEMTTHDLAAVGAEVAAGTD